MEAFSKTPFTKWKLTSFASFCNMGGDLFPLKVTNFCHCGFCDLWRNMNMLLQGWPHDRHWGEKGEPGAICSRKSRKRLRRLNYSLGGASSESLQNQSPAVEAHVWRLLWPRPLCQRVQKTAWITLRGRGREYILWENVLFLVPNAWLSGYICYRWQILVVMEISSILLWPRIWKNTCNCWSTLGDFFEKFPSKMISCKVKIIH